MKSAHALVACLALLTGCGGDGNGQSATAGDTTGGTTGGGTTGGGTTGGGTTGGGTTGGGTTGAPAWTDSVVAPERGGGEYARLTWDVQGNPHVLYRDSSDGMLRHAWRSGGVWSHEIVEASFSALLGAVADQKGGLHILYSGPGLRYGFLGAGGWSLSPVMLTVPSDVVFAVDPSGTPYFAYRSATAGGNASLLLAHLAGGAWITQTVDSWTQSFNTGTTDPIGLQLDSAGKAWLAYDRTSLLADMVHVAEPTATGWSVQSTAMADLAAASDYAVAADGTEHLVSLDALKGTLTHVYGSGAFWTTEQLSLPVSDSTAPLMLDGGAPVVATVLASGNPKKLTLQVSRRGASGWSTQQIPYDTGGATTTPTFAGLAGFDPSARPVLLAPPLVTREQGLDLTQFPSAGGQTTQAVDVKLFVWPDFSTVVAPDGTARVILVEDSHDGLRTLLVAAEGQPWSAGPPIASALSEAHQPQLRYDSAGHAHAAYIGAGGSLLHGVEGSGGWTWETVLSGAETDTLALALDGAGVPHVFYRVAGELKHAVKNGTWQSQDVGPVFVPTSGQPYTPQPRAIVDAAGALFVAYRDYSNIELARLSAGTWQVADLGQAASPADRFPATFGLTLDGNGHPCVAHGSYTAGTVEDCLAGSALTTTILSTRLSFVAGAARDDSGQLQLMIYDESFGGGADQVSLAWMHQVAGAWTVDALTGVYYLPSFMVTGDGAPLAVFRDPNVVRLHAIHP